MEEDIFKKLQTDDGSLNTASKRRSSHWNIQELVEASLRIQAIELRKEKEHTSLWPTAR